ncbi:unnamed protein product [Cylindrotheca closterium]|uniref:Uncharacterized protein n=1 Tax=Cylindrotheca closterium TaxID=2856 RepID=A0AAD2FLS5_9STRA|nr:unnamed protein product [Cylindrotheca closterium]
MRLQPLPRDELLDIAERGSATAVTVLLFWGNTAPAIIFDKTEDVPRLCRYGALTTTIVVIGCFRSSYRKLLTPDLSENERKLGFVLFWSVGSAFCEVISWLFIEWHARLFATARLLMHGVSWQALTSLGCYDSSSWYESLKMENAMACLHLSGKLFFLALACSKYNQQVRSELEFREALFWFSTLGIFQGYSLVIQSFSLSRQMDGLESSWPDPANSLDQCLVWSIFVIPILGSLVSSTFAYQLLFNKGGVQPRQQQAETRPGAGGS